MLSIPKNIDNITKNQIVLRKITFLEIVNKIKNLLIKGGHSNHLKEIFFIVKFTFRTVSTSGLITRL